MLGTIVNFSAIIIGSVIGLLFNKIIPERFRITIVQGLGLSVIMVGIINGLKSDSLLLIIISIVLGSYIGELLRIEENLEKLGQWLENKFSKDNSNFIKSFVTSSLIFCVGSMAIVGSLESGLTQDHKTLYVKSLLDGIASIIFASSLGIGVIFSSVIVLIYQGTITITASLLKPYLTDIVINQMTSIGGIIIIGIGINILEIKKIKVGNMIPSIFIPLIYFISKLLFVYFFK
ncbi:MAG: DUF554 domain-containing protein [Spirochaetes bacterium]|nr:DUF554 domain-containing protein [Spirochaetota bacterium]